MKSLSIFLSAAALIGPAGALAQTVTPPPEEDTPKATLKTPAPKPGPTPNAAPAPAPAVTPTPGVSWKVQPGPRWAAPAVSVAPAPVIARPAPPAPPARITAAPAPAPRAAAPTSTVRAAAPASGVRAVSLPPPLPPRVRAAPPSLPPMAGPQFRRPFIARRGAPPAQWGEVVEETVTVDADGREQRTVVRREMTPPDMMMHGGGPAPYARIERGGRVPGHWMDPRFLVRDFGRYGFYQPMWGGRWIRYYDDALLVDPYGQVIDGQWGMKWDEYAGDWRRGPDGIPEYVGTGDYVPGDADYAAVRGPHGYGSAPGYGYGGYAYPGAGAITIVETVTTTAPTVEERVWYEEAPRRR